MAQAAFLRQQFSAAFRIPISRSAVLHTILSSASAGIVTVFQNSSLSGLSPNIFLIHKQRTDLVSQPDHTAAFSS